MARDYYSILGVLPNASPEEIRSAYRSRAKRYHPDHFGRDAGPFRRIQEAYDVLSDPALRNTYDSGLRGIRVRHAPAPAEGLRPGRGYVEPLKPPREKAVIDTIEPMRSFRTTHPSLEEIADGMWSAFARRYPTKSEQFRTFTMEVVLSPDEARRGGRFRVLVPAGAECPSCGGSGMAGYFPCPDCGGRGGHRGEIPLDLEFPPGIRDGYEVAVPPERLGAPGLCLILCFRI